MPSARPEWRCSKSTGPTDSNAGSGARLTSSMLTRPQKWCCPGAQRLHRRASEGVGEWLLARSLQWASGGVLAIAIDPAATYRKASGRSLPRKTVSADAFNLIKLGNDMLTHVRQGLTQQGHGRRGLGMDPTLTHRRWLPLAGDTLSGRGRARLGHRLRKRRAVRQLSCRMAGQGTDPGPARHRVSGRRSRLKRPPAHPDRTGESAEIDPSLAHDLPVVE